MRTRGKGTRGSCRQNVWRLCALLWLLSAAAPAQDLPPAAPASPSPAPAASPAAAPPAPDAAADSPAPLQPSAANPLQPEPTLIPNGSPVDPYGDLPTRDDESPAGVLRPTNSPQAKPAEASPLLGMDPLARTALQMAQTNAETFFDGVGGVPRPLSSLYLNQNLLSSGNAGFRRGDLTFEPTVSLGANYRTTSGQHNGNDGTQAYGLLSPAFDLSLGEPATGRLLDVDYLGSLILGDRGDRSSQYDQSFATRGVFTFTKLVLGVGLQFSQLSGATRDTGGADISHTLLGVSLTANYAYSEKTSFESDLTAPIRLFGGSGLSSEGVTSTNFLNYAYSPLTTVGIGLTGGVLTVEDSRTQYFGQALARISYVGDSSIVYNGSAGVEYRVIGSVTEVNPVFGLGLVWQPRLGTQITVSADRRVVNSAADVGYNFVTSSVAVTAAQRLGSFWQALLSVGYENANYDRTDNSQAALNREDNYVVVQGGLTVLFNEHLSASALVTYGNNQSRQDGVEFFESLIQFTYSY